MGVDKIRFPESSGIGIKPISVEGTERIVRAAIQYAIDNDKDSVTLVHKGNIMIYTEGSFKNWGYEISETKFDDMVFNIFVKVIDMLYSISNNSVKICLILNVIISIIS